MLVERLGVALSERDGVRENGVAAHSTYKDCWRLG